MQTLVLLNPAAGGKKAGRNWPTLEPVCRKHLGDFALHRSQGPGEATAVVRAALLGGVRRIVAVGGDGTNHEVVNGFWDPTTRQAIAPDALFGWVSCGTGGDFKRSFPDLPKDHDALLQRIARSPGRRVDLMAVTCATDAGPHWRIGLNVASVGQGGDVARRVNATGKWLSGGLPFVFAGIAGAYSVQPWDVQFRFDDEPLATMRVRHVAICNGGFHGGGMNVSPTARLDDGRLEVVAMGDVGWLKSIGLGVSQFWGKMQRFDGVWQRHVVRRLEIVPDPAAGDMLVEVDGELAGRGPVTFDLLPGALMVAI